jgi:hypothetical protein
MKTLMRKINCMIACLLLSFLVSSAQGIIDQDAVLKNIRSQIPEGWTAETKDKKLVFSRKDSVWVKHVNKINRPVNAVKLNAEQRAASFKKEGKRTKSIVSYRLEPKWSAAALKKAEDQNKKTFGLIFKLPAKFKIEALYDSVASEKGSDVYIAKTTEDKSQIKKFEEERDKLMKQVIALPYLQSEKFSLFPDASSGAEDAYTDVYPEQASMELYKIQNIVNELCKAKTK